VYDGGKSMARVKNEKKKIMIIKRNGNLEAFDPEKIKRAVCSSA